MYIKKITIKNFRKTGKNFVWELRKDVNALLGHNGIGKTTVFRVLQAIFAKEESDFDVTYLTKVSESTQIEFSEGGHLHVDYESGEPKDFREMTPQDFANGLSVVVVPSFEYEFGKDIDSVRTKIDYLNKKEKENIKTHLDLSLVEQKSLFKDYQKNLYEKIVQEVRQRKIKNIEKASEQIFEDFDKFVGIVNAFFASENPFVNKELDKEHEDLFFKLKSQDIYLSWSDLSSGEKQLLLILLHTFLNKPAISNKNKTCTLIMDEPEISLHEDWQEILIEKVREINPNCQLILVTHSPIIFLNWQGTWKRLETLLQDEQRTEILSQDEAKGIKTPLQDKSINISSLKIKIDVAKIQKIKTKIDEIIKSTEASLRRTYEFNIFIKNENNLSFEECREILDYLKEKINPDSITFGTMVGRTENFEDAKKLYAEAKELVEVNNIFLNNLLKKASFDEVEEFLEQEKVRDFPDIITFSIWLGKARSQQDIQKIEATRKYYGVMENEQYKTKLIRK